MSAVDAAVPQSRHHRPLRRCWVLALGLALVLSGCGGPAYVTQQQTVDDLTMTIEHPQELAILEDYALFVTLTDAQGQPVDDAIVFFDLTMPAMPMATNAPIAEPLGAGRYRATAVFTMEGGWLMIVNVNTAGREYTAVFEYDAVIRE